MSAAAGAGSAAKNGFSRCGSELREARERLGWDLGEVAAALRIKLAYLDAIEDGRLSALPGNAYALGFLRSYATALGLDADDVTRRFRLEAADVNRRPDLSFPSPVPERGVPTSAAILVGLMVVVVAYGAWYRFGDHETIPTHSVPAVPAQLLPEHRAIAISPQVASVMPSTPLAPLDPKAGDGVPARPGGTASIADGDNFAARSAGTPSPGQPAGTAPASTASPSLPASSAAVGTPPIVAPPVAPPAGPMSAPPAATMPAPPTGTMSAPPTGTGATAAGLPSGTVLVASAPSWIEVRTADGKVLTDHVLQSGETWQAPAGVEGLLLTTGNAGGLAISRNGVKGPVIGAPGAVLRRLPLDTAVAASSAAVTPSAPITSPTAPSANPLAPASVTAPGSATPPSQAATRPRATRPGRPPGPSNDESADQLNARELGDKTAPRH